MHSPHDPNRPGPPGAPPPQGSWGHPQAQQPGHPQQPPQAYPPQGYGPPGPAKKGPSPWLIAGGIGGCLMMLGMGGCLVCVGFMSSDDAPDETASVAPHDGLEDPIAVAPPPRGPAPRPGVLAADGLPVYIPPPSSKSPKRADFAATPREVTVRNSSFLNCETRMVREWLEARCFSNSLGVPMGISIHNPPVQAYKNEDLGTRQTLLIQVVRGRSAEVLFSWNDGAVGTSYDLVIHWPSSSPRPQIYFRPI